MISSETDAGRTPATAVAAVDLDRDNRRFLLAIAASVLATVVLYRNFFAWLVDQWSSDRLYSHGFVVPLVSFYLVWVVRERLLAVATRPAPWLAGCLLLPAAAALIAGRWGAFVQLEAISFLLLLPGVILLLWGRHWCRILLFPMLYLQFMVPWLDPVLPRLQKPFQLLSAQLSVWLFKVLGVPVLHRGVFIDLPNISLEVARECSGVHFILSVMAIALPLVYLTQRTWKRAAVVLVSGTVITILANGLRIFIDGCLGLRYGADLLHGPGHIFRGWFVAQVGWVGVFLVNWIVGRGGDRSAPKLCDRWRSGGSEQEPRRSPPLRHVVWLTAAIVGCALVLASAAPRPVPLKAPLEAFPLAMGPWSGRDIPWPEVERMFPGADETLSRVYQDEAGRQGRLFLGYAERQTAGKALVSFHADELHHGARYVPTGLQRPWPAIQGENQVRIGDSSYATAFWYQLPDRGSPKKVETKLATVREALFENRTGGMVILAAFPAPGMSGAVADQGARADFLGLVRARIPEFMSLAGPP